MQTGCSVQLPPPRGGPVFPFTNTGSGPTPQTHHRSSNTEHVRPVREEQPNGAAAETVSPTQQQQQSVNVNEFDLMQKEHSISTRHADPSIKFTRNVFTLVHTQCVHTGSHSL